MLCLHRARAVEATGADDASGEDTIHRTVMPLPGPAHLDTYHPSLTAVLTAMITAHHTTAANCAQAHHADGDGVLAWALLYLDNTDGSGPVRVVTAVDADDRAYHLTRRLGENHPIVTLAEDADPQASPTRVALAALIAATAISTTGPAADPAGTSTDLAGASIPATPAATEPAVPDVSQGNETPATFGVPNAGHGAELARVLLDCGRKAHPTGRPSDRWLAEAVAALTQHIHAVTADHAREAADATRCATFNRTDLARTRALFREQIIGAIVEDKLDYEIGAGILAACGLARPRRHYTVSVTVPFHVHVTGDSTRDAAEEAIDHLEVTLQGDERIDPDWAAHETGRIKPGELDLDLDDGQAT